MTNYLIRGAFPSLIPLIAESQGWSQGQVAILFSAFPTGYVLTQIPAGAWLFAALYTLFIGAAFSLNEFGCRLGGTEVWRQELADSKHDGKCVVLVHDTARGYERTERPLAACLVLSSDRSMPRPADARKGSASTSMASERH